MSAATTSKPANGTPVDDGKVAAIAYEQSIADEAAEIRGDAIGLTRELFLKLWPLLRRPIHAGFIVTVPPTKGKPYPSTGIKSVQVQINRMDNVLTPFGWEQDIEYDEGGKRAHVVVKVIGLDGEVFFERESVGGVNQGSTIGNIYKGSYTNAAKLAFAHVGPGHEVYIGAAEFDPDVDEAAANAAQAPTGQPAAAEPALGQDSQQKIVDAFLEAEQDIALYLKAVGAADINSVTASQAYKLRELLDAKIAQAPA